MKTTTIRIPVLVNDQGQWCAYGYPDFSGHGADWSVHYDVLAAQDGPEPDAMRRVWVTAEIPLPENETIEVAAASVALAKGRSET